MSPTQIQSPHDSHAKKENIGPLKINKDSHSLKKSSPSSSSSSTCSLVNGVASAITKPQQRHPVIIYTHSPKIIHTHPKDFMALVQKLTGLSRSDDDQNVLPQPKCEPNIFDFNEDSNKNANKGIMSDDNESSSVVTDENNGSLVDGQVNSCYVPPPIFDPPNSCFSSSINPFFNPNGNATDFLCSSQPFYNYSDSLFFMSSMRSSFSSSTLEGMKELPDF